jgi:hypothetical protein
LAHSGKFNPKNPLKYKGDWRNVVYRSSWELQFMMFCDSNKSVILWSSEEIAVNYRSPITGKPRRYFPDFWVRMIDKNGKTIEKIVEIKPHSQCSPPKKKKKVTKKYLKEVETYLINQKKWQNATKFCESRNMEFVVMTEYHLGIKKRLKTREKRE